MKQITVDPGRRMKPIKPMHGVNAGPLTMNARFDASEFYRDAHIPFARLHDIEGVFGGGEYVDIHNIFRDFTRDPDDPTAYNFVMTDVYIKAIEDTGCKTFYRLGETIEHHPVKRYIYPPKDMHKWAEVCSHIVAHYNKGWANGFHYGIEYWEIWNEPEGPDCWLGTEAEMFALYDAAATAIKRDHPEVKVGGLAFAYAQESPYMERFLQHVRETGVPLDFVSWHKYACHMDQVKESLAAADAAMDKHGFGQLESIITEWSQITDWNRLQKDFDLRHTAFRAAFMTAFMSLVQDQRPSSMMHYTVQAQHSRNFGGVFSFDIEETNYVRTVPPIPMKPYYALKAWDELYQAGMQIDAEANSPEIYAVAAEGADEYLVLVTSFNGSQYNAEPPADDTLAIDLPGADMTKAVAWVVDDARTYEAVPFENGRFVLKGNTFALIKIRK